jgi:hypothetical protein
MATYSDQFLRRDPLTFEVPPGHEWAALAADQARFVLRRYAAQELHEIAVSINALLDRVAMVREGAELANWYLSTPEVVPEDARSDVARRRGQAIDTRMYSHVAGYTEVLNSDAFAVLALWKVADFADAAAGSNESWLLLMEAVHASTVAIETAMRADQVLRTRVRGRRAVEQSRSETARRGAQGKHKHLAGDREKALEIARAMKADGRFKNRMNAAKHIAETSDLRKAGINQRYTKETVYSWLKESGF